jgi:hypothetical protein
MDKARRQVALRHVLIQPVVKQQIERLVPAKALVPLAQAVQPRAGIVGGIGRRRAEPVEIETRHIEPMQPGNFAHVIAGQCDLGRFRHTFHRNIARHDLGQDGAKFRPSAQRQGRADALRGDMAQRGCFPPAEILAGRIVGPAHVIGKIGVDFTAVPEQHEKAPFPRDADTGVRADFKDFSAKVPFDGGRQTHRKKFKVRDPRHSYGNPLRQCLPALAAGKITTTKRLVVNNAGRIDHPCIGPAFPVRTSGLL